MKCLSWNIRGFNDPQKLIELKKLLKEFKINIVGLLETKVKYRNFANFSKKFGTAWKWTHNYDYSSRGRIWLGWNSNDLIVDILMVTVQLIHCKVFIRAHNCEVLLTIVYGLHSIEARRPLWDDLVKVASNQPWLVCGDFNAVLDVDDRISGADVTDYECRDFKLCLADAGLQEIATKGCRYTWNSKGDGVARISSKLDRGLVNMGWLNAFPNVFCSVLTPGVSDHSPLFFDCWPEQGEGGRPFKFLNVIAEHEKFDLTVRGVWNEAASGRPMVKVWYKLKRLKQELKALQRREFGHVEDRIDHANVEFNSVK